MAVTIQKITTNKDIRSFYDVASKIYQNNPHWAPAIELDTESIFAPQKNKLFLHGECERFLIFKDSHPVGRFALMNNAQHDFVFQPKLGGIGFIEIEDDQTLAHAMIQYAKEWHHKRGYSAMRGPINFGPVYNNWGLLIEGFDQDPYYGVPYHLPYYQKLVENTNAEKFEDIYNYERAFRHPIDPQIIRINDRLKQNPKIECRPLELKNLEREIIFIYEVYNDAWKHQQSEKRSQEFRNLNLEEMITAAKAMKPFIQPETCALAFVDGVPAAFGLTIPDLNQLAKKLHGKIRWWNIISVLRFKHQASRCRALAFGIRPKYRHVGLIALMFVNIMQKTTQRYPNLNYAGAGWIAENNRLSQASAERMGFDKITTHRIYRWIFG